MGGTKLSILLVVLLTLVILFSGCIGGNGDEDKGISSDKTTAGAEKTVVKASCDDGNACTTDVFNELTGDCEHKMANNCCGNDKCEAGERCDYATYKTVCAEDCALTCPAHLIANKPGDETQTENTYVCGSSVTCELTGENSFKISGVGKTTITTTVTNMGERASDVIDSKFYCDYGFGQAKFDSEKVNGIEFWDYFETKEQDKFETLNALQSGSNSVGYILDIDMANKINTRADVTCRIVLDSADFSNTQTLKLKFVD